MFQAVLCADLRASDPDLGPCVDVDAAVGLPADGRAHGVGHPHHQRTLVRAVNAPVGYDLLCLIASIAYLVS